MGAPKLKLGKVEFEVPFMSAGILQGCAGDLEVYANIAPGKVVLSAAEVGALVSLTHALAMAGGLSLTREQVLDLVNTNNLPAVIHAIGYAYIGKPEPGNEAPPGEAGSPSASTGPGTPGP